MNVELTESEKKWIKEFQKVCSTCPKSLWLFNDGKISILKYPPDGGSRFLENGCVDPEYVVGNISNIMSDGGDW